MSPLFRWLISALLSFLDTDPLGHAVASPLAIISWIASDDCKWKQQSKWWAVYLINLMSSDVHFLVTQLRAAQCCLVLPRPETLTMCTASACTRWRNQTMMMMMKISHLVARTFMMRSYTYVDTILICGNPCGALKIWSVEDYFYPFLGQIQCLGIETQPMTMQSPDNHLSACYTKVLALQRASTWEASIFTTRWLLLQCKTKLVGSSMISDFF